MLAVHTMNEKFGIERPKLAKAAYFLPDVGDILSTKQKIFRKILVIK